MAFKLSKDYQVSNLYRAETGTYYLLVKRGGHQFRRSLKTKDRELAKRRLREFQNKADRLPTSQEARTMLFEELASQWLASVQPVLKPKGYLRRVAAVKGLLPSFRGVTVRNLGHAQIEKWKTQRGAKLAARTWNIEMETLRLVMNYAQKTLKIILDNPAAEVERRKLPTTEKLIPTKDEFRALLAEMRASHKVGEGPDFVEFLAYSGMRQGEASTVRWRDVSFENGTLTVTSGEAGTKNQQHRTIPLFAPLYRLLETFREQNSRARWDVPIFSISSARKALETATGKLGMPNYGHLSMRHFFCSNCIEAGVDFKVIAEWLGHSDGGVLVARTYGHLRNEHSTAMALRITFDASPT